MESFPPSIAYRLPSDFVTVSEDFPAMLFAKSILARFTGKQMWVLYKFKAVSHLNLKFVAGTSSDAGD